MTSLPALRPLLVAGVVLGALGFACEADDGGPSPTSGDSGSGGSGAADGGVTSYACIATRADNDPDPGGTEGAAAECCSGLGTCTALSDLSGDPYRDRYGVSTCDPSAELVCAPNPDDQQPAGGATPPCTLTLGGTPFEGRCLPRCFVIGTPGAGNLDAGDCDTGVVSAEVVCAPCFSPLDGQETGACTRRAGDAPVEPAPTPFAECGRFPADNPSAPLMGYCIELQVVVASGQSADAIAQLPRESCAEGELCVPKSKVEHVDDCFDICESPVAAKAVCVPTYILEAPGSVGENFSEVLDPGQQICGSGFTCTPCISPVDGAPTGACAN